MSPNITALLNLPAAHLIGRRPQETGLTAELRQQWEAAFERVHGDGAPPHVDALLVIEGPAGAARCRARLAACRARKRAAVACTARLCNANVFEGDDDADTRFKTDFLAVLGHELRLPLAAIRSAAKLLTLPETGAERRREALAVLQRQSTQAAALVDNLLDITRIARRSLQVELRAVALKAVVAESVEAVRELIEQRRHCLTVQIDDCMIVQSDPVRLREIITNLVSNAAKYTDIGGTIEISAREEEGYAVLRVHDNGSGISPYMLPRLFDLYARDDGHRAVEGLGIGLYLVRQLTWLLGASVSAHSAGKGRGSEFRVRLPLYELERND